MDYCRDDFNQQIIDTYLTLVNSSNQPISIDKICRHLAITHETFYEYYQGIDDVVHSLFNEKCKELDLYLQSNVPSTPFLNAYLTYWYNNQDIIRMIFILEKDYLFNDSFKKLTFIQNRLNSDQNVYFIFIRIAILKSVIKQWYLDDFTPEPLCLALTLTDLFNQIVSN